MLFDLSASHSPYKDTWPHLFSVPKHQSNVNVSNILDMSHISEDQPPHSGSVELEKPRHSLDFLLLTVAT